MRPRPLAGCALEGMAGRSAELARRWAIALILGRPLGQIAEIPFEQVALDGPALCEEVLRALRSDGELELLAGAGAAGGGEPTAAQRLAAIAGAREPVDTVRAVEALRGVLWMALAGELRERPAVDLAEAGDRLAHVCATLLEGALWATQSPEQGAVGPRSQRPSDRPPSEGSVVALIPGARAVIVDERTDTPQRSATSLERRPSPAGASEEQIEIRDERHGEGPTAWISSIGAQLLRFAEDGVPFAVLLVELMDSELVRSQEPAGELERMLGALEQLLAAELGALSGDVVRQRGPLGAPAPAAGSLTRERSGRFWMLSPGIDRAGAQRLAERLELAAGAIHTVGGRSLALAIGTASCPQDGREASALAAHADVGLYAARADARRSSAVDRPA